MRRRIGPARLTATDAWRPRAVAALVPPVPWLPAGGALALFVLDVFVMGQGLLALALLLAVALWLAPKAWLYRRVGRDARGHVRRALSVTVCASAILLAINGNNAVARHRAETLIAAIEDYRELTGRYPDSLDALVPAYIAAIPRAKLSLTYNRYQYRAGDGFARLAYIDVPPFGRVTFDFARGRWSDGN